MQDDKHAHRRAVRERDSARARVRRVTGIVLAASVVVAGTLASYVSNAASGRKKAAVATPTRTTPRTARKSAQVPVPAAPAAPALLSSGSSPSQSNVPQVPAQAPVQTEAPPVAVSGGS